MLDPRTGEVLALASTPTYDASAIADPATAEATFEALRRTTRPAAPAAGDARPIRPGLGVQDRDRDRRPGLGRDRRPATTYEEQPGAEKKGLVVDGFRIRDGHHPETGDRALDLIGATEVSCNIWYALTGLEIGGAALVDYAGRLGFGAPHPVRPADGRVAR